MAQFYHPTKSSDSNDFAVNMITGRAFKTIFRSKGKKTRTELFSFEAIGVRKVNIGLLDMVWNFRLNTASNLIGLKAGIEFKDGADFNVCTNFKVIKSSDLE